MKKPSLSFEFFPPKTPAMELKLWDAVKRLEPLRPAFVSVTYGAGGGTRERTHAVVRRILRETTLTPAAHLTCVAASRDEIAQVADGYWGAGVRHIVALRGDPPQGTESYAPHPGGYAYACDLVAGLKSLHDFEISVAAFPEKHPQSASFDVDLDILQKKIDAGATRAITQYFFDTGHYFRLLDKARARGIATPIVPGILPIGNFAQMKKFSAMCGASVPAWLEEMFAGLDEQPEKRHDTAVRLAARQCRELLDAGAEHLHFYTLNRSELVEAVCRELGIKTTART